MKKLLLELTIIAFISISLINLNASATENGGKIAFYSQRDGNAEIYVIDADGTDLHRLTDNSARDVCPGWSPDGAQIVFVSDRDGNHEIYVMDADGRNQQRLTDHTAAEQHPDWSPDGSRIIFVSARDENKEIYIMDADGNNLSRLTDNDYDDVRPHWSPDGEKILFNIKNEDDYGIYVMNADGSDRQCLINTAAWELFPRWSPDGSKIVFFANADVPLSERDVYVMNADGSDMTQLTDTKAIDEDPGWSPDGIQLVFQSNRDDNYEIYIMNADGTGQRNLTNNPSGDYWPSWSSQAQNEREAQSEGVIIDGRFDDWADMAPVYIDTLGDHLGSSIDFGALWATSDSARLYLCLEIGAEHNLQNGNDIVLYLDTDRSSRTGYPVDGIGAEIEWAFGRRRGRAHIAGDTVSLNPASLRLRQGPTVTSARFEISLGRDAMVKWTPLFPADSIAILLRNENEEDEVSDRLPNGPDKVEIALSDQRPAQPAVASIGRQDPGHLRVLSYNVLFDGLFARPGPFITILRALDPDVICFQEIWNHTAKQTADMVSLALPDAPWYAEKGFEGVIVSRYPIVDSHPTMEETGNLWALIDLPDNQYATDLSVINAHPPCCENNAGREMELDAIAAWTRELKAPGGRELPEGTPMIIAGDMNLVGPARQLEILLSGEIINQDRYGPSFSPDWDDTGLTDVMPYHNSGRESYTWRSISEQDGSFAPGRLDYILYTDSVLGLGNHFILCTEEMSLEEAIAARLGPYDTLDASDHLPVVADFILPAGGMGSDVSGGE